MGSQYIGRAVCASSALTGAARGRAWAFVANCLFFSSINQTDQMLVHLQSFDTVPEHFTIPESTKNGVPLFYIPPGSTTPVCSLSLCLMWNRLSPLPVLVLRLHLLLILSSSCPAQSESSGVVQWTSHAIHFALWDISLWLHWCSYSSKPSSKSPKCAVKPSPVVLWCVRLMGRLTLLLLLCFFSGYPVGMELLLAVQPVPWRCNSVLSGEDTRCAG